MSRNFATFQEALCVACLEKYGNQGRLIDDDEYFVPPAVNKVDHVPPPKDDGESEDDEDILEVYHQGYVESIKQRIKDIAKMKSQRSLMYGYIQ